MNGEQCKYSNYIRIFRNLTHNIFDFPDALFEIFTISR